MSETNKPSTTLWEEFGDYFCDENLYNSVIEPKPFQPFKKQKTAPSLFVNETVINYAADDLQTIIQLKSELSQKNFTIKSLEEENKNLHSLLHLFSQMVFKTQDFIEHNLKMVGSSTEFKEVQEKVLKKLDEK